MFKNKLIILSAFLVCLFASCANAYEVALITYPEYNKNWRQIYLGKQNEELISQWIPSYADNNNWTESIVFHSYKWAKGNSCRKFITNLLINVENRNPTIKTQILKNKFEDAVAIWCVDKTKTMDAQCEILRVTASHEGLTSIHYINKNPEAFHLYQKENWLPVIRNIRIYYSYYRWDRITGKEKDIQLQ